MTGSASRLYSFLLALVERVQTLSMLRLAETSFAEWNEEGEDIYDDAAAAR